MQLSEVLHRMDSSSRVPSAVYSPVAAFRSVPDLGAYPITGCPFLFSNYLFICSSAAELSHSPIVETPSAEPIPVVEEVEASMERASNEGTGAIVTAKSPSLTPHNDAAQASSSLVDDALPSASALLTQVACDEPLSEPDSDKGSVIMGTPGADSDEDLLPFTSSQVEGEEFSQLLDRLHDSDGSSSQHAPRKPKKKSSHRHSSNLVPSFKKTLGANDIV